MVQESANLGSPTGMTDLAVCYEFGEGVDKDVSTAIGWYQKASDLGYTYATDYWVPCTIAERRCRIGVKPFRFMIRLQKLGDINGILDLGCCYRDGIGTSVDLNQAVAWFQKAADSGNVLGMTDLAYVYQNGPDSIKDYGQAMSWFVRLQMQAMEAVWKV